MKIYHFKPRGNSERSACGMINRGTILALSVNCARCRSTAVFAERYKEAVREVEDKPISKADLWDALLELEAEDGLEGVCRAISRGYDITQSATNQVRKSRGLDG